MDRRIPRPRDLAPLMKFKKPEAGSRRAGSSALTIEDLRRIAKRRTPKAAFDYTDGSAEAELSIARARQAFRDIEFHPAILRDVSKVTPVGRCSARRSSLPFGIAPTGFTRMMQTEGEIAGAHAAAKAGIPFSLSTWAPPRSRRSRRRTRTAATGFSCTCGKTGTGRCSWSARGGGRVRHVAGHRRRAGRGSAAARQAQWHDHSARAHAAHRAGCRAPPAWWIDFLTTEPLAFASLDRWSGTVAELLDSMFDPTVTFEDLAWIKSQWPDKLVVKGIQTRRGRTCGDRPRCRRHRAVQPRWTPARPGARSVPPIARGGREVGR